MKNRGQSFAAGLLAGALVFGGGTAAAAGLTAEVSANPIYVDGQQVRMTAYKIGGNNYVKLRDVGKAVGFNVYWQNGVQIDSDAPYTGEAPREPKSKGSSVDLNANMEIRREMIRLINEVRREHGVAELAVDESLMNAAQDTSAQKFEHHNEYEFKAARAYGYSYGVNVNLTWFNRAGESSIAERAVQNWVRSSGHFQTMTAERYDTLGVGVTISNDIAYCYMFVGNPNGHNADN